MKKRINGIVITLLSINLLLLGYFFLVEYKPEAAQCLNDPLVYGYNQLQEANDYPLVCGCSLQSPNPSPRLVFDSEGRKMQITSTQTIGPGSNWSPNVTLGK